MSETALYTIREIARQLALPESTVRYYRDAFVEHIPAVGIGRRRRYPANAVAILRSVAHGFAAGRSREEIAAGLRGRPGPAVEHQPPVLATHEPPQISGLQYDELLTTVLNGERERREAMWKMAREIVRLGEAIEQQHVVLGEITEKLANQADRSLTAGSPTPAADLSLANVSAVADAAPAQLPELLEEVEALREQHQEVEALREQHQEVEALREQLEGERQLVERLRRSKLEMEHRTAQAEARLAEQEQRPRRRSVLGRLLPREPLEGERGG